MGWRFRKTFKVLPGVKLNLTARGLSATVGASPLSLNFGPRGVYSNMSIPGTGIWDRRRLDVPSDDRVEVRPEIPATLPISPVASSVTATEVRSASTELLNSASLNDLRGFLTEAYEERCSLESEVTTAANEASTATRRFQAWDRGFLFKRMFKASFSARKDASETAEAKLDELQEQLRLTTLATQIDIDREQAEPYYRMRDEFAALSECERIWDTLDRRPVNRAAERSAASEAITREPVRFCLDVCDLMQWEQKVPHLANRNGGDLYIYPGFILYRASRQAFALIDSREVALTFRPARFIEEETVPSDTPVVGQVWAKSNKDGSPDRRFKGNYQIPLVLYGALRFSSSSGLQEEYQCSNPASAERFAKAWGAFHATLGLSATGSRRERN